MTINKTLFIYPFSKEDKKDWLLYKIYSFFPKIWWSHFDNFHKRLFKKVFYFVIIIGKKQYNIIWFYKKIKKDKLYI